MTKHHIKDLELTTGATVSVTLCHEPGRGNFWEVENQNSHARREFRKLSELIGYLERVLDIDQDEAEVEDALHEYHRASYTEAWDRYLAEPTPDNEAALLQAAFEEGMRHIESQEVETWGK